MDIYDKIDAVLREKHMSRRQLAIAAGIPESSLAASFARRSKMSPDNLEKITQTLMISPAELMPQLQVFQELIENRTQDINELEEQRQHVILQAAICDDMKARNVLQALHKNKNIDNLYSILASAFTLNAEGQEKAIQYLIDINKIREYRQKDIRYIAQKIQTEPLQEVTQCPEDAPQTAAEHNHGSDLMDDGK